MNKQTNAEQTLERGKGKYKGDEDKLKSSTDNPRKELILEYIQNIEEILSCMDTKLLENNDKNYLELSLLVYAFLNQTIRHYKKILLNEFNIKF